MQVPHHFLQIPGYILSPEGPHNGPIQSPDHPRLANTMKTQGYSIFPWLCQLLPSFHLWKFRNHSSTYASYHKGTPWHFSDQCNSAFEALKKAFTTAPVLTHWILDIQITVETDPSDYAFAAVPFNYDSQWWIAPDCIPLLEIFCPGTQLGCPQQRATCNFLKLSNNGKHTLKALDFWSMSSPITRIWNTFQWPNPDTSTSMLIQIPFQIQPGYPFLSWKLRTKPNALTGWWDVYLKEGNSDYAVSIHRTTTWYSLLSNWHHPFELPPYQSQASMDLSSWMLKGSILTSGLNFKRIPFLQNTTIISQNPRGTLWSQWFTMSGQMHLCSKLLGDLQTMCSPVLA